ncbi:DUF4159 domain-containing protein [Phycisphaera mikurensis]|uniref:DUF4159 domain-containing protein n=1 Tax=Phycisphaera mikurensis (strain NBRC 102666 / KCTC 22515 / FYK2301M01) TaxID=1142394 RepID=I0IDM6_PHYMF|nr:DUF4159 domain-containing protein [Phycisphaera mikurensis]MBB6441183.1 hypothetical protein [Phycisphaera mikurensis]BAM03364.1 hypothetical protein PSMK_12050 [Phycisphaera mikurensis NBRC 102666]
MKHPAPRRRGPSHAWPLCAHGPRILALLLAAVLFVPAGAQQEPAGPGVVTCGNLIYGGGKTSTCFADHFLRQISADSEVATTGGFEAVQAGSPDLFNHPFSVMSGDGRFRLSDDEVENLRLYLTSGGFLVGSASCSSTAWNASFGEAVRQIFPDAELEVLEADHPAFHTVYDVHLSKYKKGRDRLPELRTISLDGRVVLLWSPDGLNDTEFADDDCCCCGGNEIKSARKLNVNILAYALTH